jgi:transketolase
VIFVFTRDRLVLGEDGSTLQPIELLAYVARDPKLAHHPPSGQTLQAAAHGEDLPEIRNWKWGLAKAGEHL